MDGSATENDGRPEDEILILKGANDACIEICAFKLIKMVSLV
jgi:hypothetical protein